MTSPGGQFTTKPLLRSPQGEAKVGVVPRGSPSKQVLPRTRKLFSLCTTSLLFGSPGLPVLRGVSGGGAALSSLCRRFPGGDIMNLTSRRNPLSGLSFSLFFFLRERKRGYWGDSAVIKSLSPKQNPTDYIIIPLRTSSLSQAKLSQQPRPLFSAASASLCTLSPRQPCLSRYRRR